MKLYPFLFISLTLLTFTNCGNKEAIVPSYLHISPFKFTATAAQGGESFDITNGQVFIGPRFIGDFEFPVTVPIPLLGDTVVTVIPSIKENGVSNGRKVYKLYQPFRQNVRLRASVVDSVFPTTSYRSNVNFLWVEDFDDNAISMQKGYNNNLLDSLQTYPFTNNNAYKASGKGFSAGVFFSKNTFGLNWEAFTSQKFKVPNKDQDVYVEMDLMSDIPVTVGISYVANSQLSIVQVATFFATGNQYKKLYVNLKSETSPLPEGLDIQLFFGGANYIDSIATPKVFLDNLKLAYLQ